MTAFVAKLKEEPDPVLLDRAADAEVVVPQLVQLAGRGQAAILQLLRVVVADHPVGDVRQRRSCP